MMSFRVARLLVGLSLLMTLTYTSLTVEAIAPIQLTKLTQQPILTTTTTTSTPTPTSSPSHQPPSACVTQCNDNNMSCLSGCDNDPDCQESCSIQEQSCISACQGTAGGKPPRTTPTPISSPLPPLIAKHLLGDCEGACQNQLNQCNTNCNTSCAQQPLPGSCTESCEVECQGNYESCDSSCPSEPSK